MTAERDKWGRPIRVCTFDGCGRIEALRRGLCGLHYERWRRHGDPSILLIGNPEHGTINMYGNHGCRCDECRAAWRDWWREMSHRTGRHKPRAEHLAEVRAKAQARDNHGTETRYKLGCRCGRCRAGASEARRKRRHASARAAA